VSKASPRVSFPANFSSTQQMNEIGEASIHMLEDIGEIEMQMMFELNSIIATWKP
jgi:hypothetical protein